MAGRAPGADDDGSGTFVLVEALRVLLMDERIKAGEAENTIEFHWYAGEEGGGLLGSQAVFLEYRSEGREVKAMLQLDMAGYVDSDSEVEERLGVVTDHVDPRLTRFVERVIAAVRPLHLLAAMTRD